jgi:PQQ-like domain
VSTGALNATTTYSLTCTGSGGSATAAATVSITNTSAFATTPRVATLTLSQSQQFTAAVTGGGAATWSVDGIVGGNATVGSISSGGLYVPPSTPGTHTVLATSVADPTKSGTAVAAVTDLAGNFTFHNDLARTGQNLQEYALTTSTVSGGTFGKRWACPVDGDIYGQPLYVANLSIGGGTHNVVFVVTQNDSIYAIDADSSSCATYWQKSLLGAGVTPISYLDLGGCNDSTQFGITGTPVIDPTTLTMYFVAQTKESGSFFQRLHALNIQTGAEQAGSPAIIPTTIPGSSITFSALWQSQRPGLALFGGGVFIAWASHCDILPYWGLVMRYNASTLSQTAVFNVAPHGTKGGIWMSAGAPAVDTGGHMFLSTGNGTFDGSAAPGTTNTTDYSMSFLNFNPATLTVQDFYTPSMEALWNSHDEDIASAGVTVLPDGMGPSGHANLLVGADKQSHIWLIDRSSMSGFSSTGDDTVQFLTLPGAPNCAGNCMLSTPAYYNGTVYVAPAANPLMALPLTGGLFGATAQNIAQASTMSAETYGYPGTTPAISASPSGNAIVWVLDNSNYANQGDTGTSPAGPALLRAYDAGNLTHRLFSSTTLAADTNGNAVKYTLPVVANGHVYVGGGGQLTVYGLAP